MNARNDESKDPAGRNPKDSQPFEATDLSKLKDLVQRFRVCWELYPEQVLTGGEIRKVGFALELYGTHEPGTGHVDPGCDHCRTVQSALNDIAGWILPREERPSTYEVSVNGQGLSYSPARGNRPDVQVTIRIHHRGDFEQPVDECELRCLKEMQKALSELGACKGGWWPSVRAEPKE
jgi:hypothetical protein